MTRRCPIATVISRLPGSTPMKPTTRVHNSRPSSGSACSPRVWPLRMAKLSPAASCKCWLLEPIDPKFTTRVQLSELSESDARPLRQYTAMSPSFFSQHPPHRGNPVSHGDNEPAAQPAAPIDRQVLQFGPIGPRFAMARRDKASG